MTEEVKDLTKEDYNLVRRLVYAKSGINLGGQKMQLVRARLGKLVRGGRFRSFREYLRHVELDPAGEALSDLLDAISTNTTHLFREMRHFDLLRELLKRWAEDKRWRADNKEVRIWSAACSSGEEPHSIAMVAHDALQEWPSLNPKILATDISVHVLSRARLGLYGAESVKKVAPAYRTKYLRKVEHDGDTYLQITPELRKLITFSRFNLMTPSFPFRRGFHVIFCRNVMIYFDKPTQQTLVNKFARHLIEGGYLMIGHSESLNGIEHPLVYAEPTVHQKKGKPS